jgi:hypothetical protein
MLPEKKGSVDAKGSRGAALPSPVSAGSGSKGVFSIGLSS